MRQHVHRCARPEHVARMRKNTRQSSSPKIYYLKQPRAIEMYQFADGDFTKTSMHIDTPCVTQTNVSSRDVVGSSLSVSPPRPDPGPAPAERYTGVGGDAIAGVTAAAGRPR